MPFTEKEKRLAQGLKEAGLTWVPAEGDWFWATDDLSHHFYLGESLPASFLFRKGECYCFDSGMTWHREQGGLTLDRFVWLPSWEQCRQFFKKHRFSLELHDHGGVIQLEARRENEKLTAEGTTDLEALYPLLLEILKTQ